ncbi:MAG: hypothetical protein LBH60_07365 [Prevotellaceae bacterium]|jgi:hypothetical protein|nr:hypothetical protein [Prevotellaceae bacterium]
MNSSISYPNNSGATGKNPDTEGRRTEQWSMIFAEKRNRLRKMQRLSLCVEGVSKKRRKKQICNK